ncbi:DUF2846 domain-containing protein [Trinickia fusca]|uniref:DUF2846 domain-containing protein n=1 Tax=Trinickia fusca TaxID=2419777 RepID=A0A494XRE9_9BURK|nr:DUF2846 domain-containing protein [Trinickia fusca]RKP50699.1 DUF2846 domain-containing protein [Trinickia fusca]
MTRIQKIAAIIAILALGACAHGESYKKVSRSAPKLVADEGRIYFYRRSNELPGEVTQPAIMLDGKKVGSAKPRGFFYVDVPAGQHTVSIRTEVEKTLSLTVESGEVAYVSEQLSKGSASGRMVPKLVDRRTARRQLKRLHYDGNGNAADTVRPASGEPASEAADDSDADAAD